MASSNRQKYCRPSRPVVDASAMNAAAQAV
jgi:hypothetical protein